MRFFQPHDANFLSILMICLVAVAGCSDGSKATMALPQPKPIVLSFQAKTSGQLVQFRLTDETLWNQVFTWRWDFGDGTGSDEQSPIHRYSDPGNYTVSLEWVDLAMHSGINRATVEVTASEALTLDWDVVLGSRDLTHSNLVGGSPGFVMVGTMGKVLFSENGFDWSEVFPHVGVNMEGLFWANDAFWAYGSSHYYTSVQETYSILLKSTNGRDWVTEFIDGMPASGFATHGETRLLAGSFPSNNGDPRRPSTSGAVLVSVGGGPWQKVFIGGHGVSAVSWTGSQFIAFGYIRASNFTNPEFFTKTSTDGFHWELSEQSLDPLLFPTATNGNLSVRTQIRAHQSELGVSEDGLNWTAVPFAVPETMHDVAWGKDRFVALGRNYSLTSANGRSWETHALPIELDRHTRLAFSNGVWLIHSPSGLLLWSGNGYEWKPHPEAAGSTSTRNWTTVATYKNGFAIGAENGTVAISEDGLLWQEQAALANFKIRSMKEIGGDLWVNGVTSTGNGAVFRRTLNGWEQILTTPKPLRDIIQFAGKCVFLDGDRLFAAELERPDDWRMILGSPEASGIKQVHVFNQNLVVLTSWKVWTSMDGESWQSHEHPIGEARVMYQWNGTWYVAGFENSFFDFATVWFRSDDLTQWQPIPFEYANHVSLFLAGHSKLVATGTHSNGPLGLSRDHPFDLVYTSRDGLTWQPESSPLGKAPSGLAYNQGRYVAVGNGFVWLQREP